LETHLIITKQDWNHQIVNSNNLQVKLIKTEIENQFYNFVIGQKILL